MVVTGAGSGIGRATALRFASRGARVLIAEINPVGARPRGLPFATIRLHPQYTT
nr:SDR family NAD(P)-dependent oxidoreductase [Amycolatopsis sp. YIM 10]